LVDTDVAVDLLREIPAAKAWMTTLGDEVLAAPGFVAMELVQGAQSKADLQGVDRFLSQFLLFWPDESHQAKAYAEFAQRHLSHSLGLVDALIAVTAIQESLVLHTFNQKHYSAVTDLKTQRPYQR
jgi:predicted nucleic acid-binding protein